MKKLDLSTKTGSRSPVLLANTAYLVQLESTSPKFSVYGTRPTPMMRKISPGKPTKHT